MLDVKLIESAEQSVGFLSRYAPDFLENLKINYPGGFYGTQFNPDFWHERCKTEYPKASKLFPLAQNRGASSFGFFAGLKLFDAKNVLAAEFRNYRLLKKACDNFFQTENRDFEKALEYANMLGLYYGSAIGNIYKMKVYVAFNHLDEAKDAYQKALNANWLDDEYQPIRDYDVSVANLTEQEQRLIHPSKLCY